MCSFNRGNSEGTNFENLCLMFVYVCFTFAKWLVLESDSTEGWYICEKSLEMCVCLGPEFDCPEVTLCGWQDIKIQLLLLYAHNKSLKGEFKALVHEYAQTGFFSEALNTI